jgi:hypothetical protein
MQSQTPITELSIDQLALQLQSRTIVWKQRDIVEFSKKSISKPTLCGKTNALINTYLGNPDDPLLQDISKDLLTRYDYADEYLLKLQSAISTAIEINRAAINTERERIQKTTVSRGRQTIYTRTNSVKQELDVLHRIAQMPEDIVILIREYLPPSIILTAISIPRLVLYSQMSPITAKKIKGVYEYIRKNIHKNTDAMMNLAGRDIIRYEDLSILQANQPGPQKDHMITRIGDICYCYNLVLNIVSKIRETNNGSRTYTCCIQLTQQLTDDLTHIYKLVNFVTRPKTKHQPNSKPRKPRAPKKTTESQIVM